jgi:hypothetical protein
VIINRVLAEQLWPAEDPVGRFLVLFSRPFQVVGLVAHERCRGYPAAVTPCAWTNFAMGRLAGTLYVRTTGAPAAFAPALRDVVRDLDPDVAMTELEPLDDSVYRLSAESRAAAAITAALAAFGMLLLSAGCFTLFRSMVDESVHEIAIRLALGVSSMSLAGRIVLQGFVLALGGVALGLVAARVVALRLTDQLYQVAPTDPLIFMALPLVVMGLATGAVYVAALEATRTAPAEYLREPN